MRFHRFTLATYAVLSIFMGIMVYATIIAFQRRSGSTGIDAAKIQQIRYEASYGLKAHETNTVDNP